MSISCRFASALLVGAGALLASSAFFTAFAYDDVPGPSYGYVDPLVAPGPVYEYAPVRSRVRVYEYAPVRRGARVYGYAPVRRGARVYGYAPARPAVRVYGYGPVYAAETPPAELQSDRRPLGIYAPHEPTDLSPPRSFFLGLDRTSGD
jgi:hypothetical protein